MAKMGMAFLPLVYGMGLKEPLQVQKKQKKKDKDTCVTKEEEDMCPPSGQEVAHLEFVARVAQAFGFSCLDAAIYSPFRRLANFVWSQTHRHMH